MKMKTPLLVMLLFLSALMGVTRESPAMPTSKPAASAPLTPRAGGQVREFRLTATAMTYEFVKGQPAATQMARQRVS